MADDDAVRRRLVVEDAAPRLDRYLADHLAELSRTQVARLLADGRITLNGDLPRKSAPLEPGDVIEVEVPAPEPSAILPEAIPLDILYEDEDLAVIHKPAGMVTHPAPGHRSGTLVNALLHHLADLSGIGGVRRPGIVHRLDKDTSGLLLVAKHDASHRKLAGALKRREVSRRYLAASWGHLEEDRQTVDAPVGRSHRNRKRMAVTSDGRSAVTHMDRLERWRAADLLEVRLETGRTHQIRVHLLSIGHPVVGDVTYGRGWEKGIGGPDRSWARELAARTPRQFLHAAELSFRHPRTGEPMRFRRELPEDLASVAEWAATTSAPDDDR